MSLQWQSRCRISSWISSNNHVICFEAMEIKKCLQEMRYDRLNSSTVARPKYGAATNEPHAIARICVKPKFTLCGAKINLEISNIPEQKAYKRKRGRYNSSRIYSTDRRSEQYFYFFQFIVGKEREKMKVCWNIFPFLSSCNQFITLKNCLNLKRQF